MYHAIIAEHSLSFLLPAVNKYRGEPGKRNGRIALSVNHDCQAQWFFRQVMQAGRFSNAK